MDFQTAQEDYHRNSFIIFDESTPPYDSFYLSLDDKTWMTGPSFSGIKLIPPGFHIISIYLINKSFTVPESGVPVSFLFFTYPNSPTVIVIGYDAKNEDWLIHSNRETIFSYSKERLMYLDTSLGVYPFENWSSWNTLSSHIKEINLKNVFLEPLCRIECMTTSFTEFKKDKYCSIYKISSLEMTSHYAATYKFVQKSNEIVADHPVSNKATFTLHFPLFQIHSLLDSPGQITESIIHDGSYLFKKILEKFYRSDVVQYIGEWQLSFLILVYCCSYEGYEHWKKLTELLCKCKNLLIEQGERILEWISIIQCQISRLPQEWGQVLDNDDDESSNWLVFHLQLFWSNIDDLVLNFCNNHKNDSLNNQFLTFKSQKSLLDQKLDLLESRPTTIDVSCCEREIPLPPYIVHEGLENTLVLLQEKSIQLQKMIESTFNSRIKRRPVEPNDEEPVIVELDSNTS